MKYVALLRGINVGGNNKVDMKQLKACFEKAGMLSVSTYINSGNVLFEINLARPGLATKDLKSRIEQAIEKEFGFAVPTLIVSQKIIDGLCAKIPKDWTNDTQQKTDVLFLWSEIDNRGIMKNIAINPDLERVLYVPGALVWNIERKNVTKGSGIKLIKSDLYPKMTARNINTVRKIHKLLE